VGKALLVDYYNELPQRREPEQAAGGAALVKKALDTYKRKVAARYTEGTLQRLLGVPDVEARRAAVLALGLLGTMASNRALAGRLRDEDTVVRQLAADALWALWFRSDSRANCAELQRLVRQADPAKALPGMDRLIQKSPRFAEAYNQRAIVHFRMGEYQKAIADCEATLRLNPCHFGAQAGMAQCFIKLRKPRPALRALRSALKINPGLDGVAETIRALEEVLGEEGK
jgi:tetratricopeptide (TPR) repeat protein